MPLMVSLTGKIKFGRSLLSSFTVISLCPRCHRLELHTTVSLSVVAVPDVHVWNKLPADVLAANSVNVFHRRLKTHLFTAAFGDK